TRISRVDTVARRLREHTFQYCDLLQRIWELVAKQVARLMYLNDKPLFSIRPRPPTDVKIPCRSAKGVVNEEIGGIAYEPQQPISQDKDRIGAPFAPEPHKNAPDLSG